MISKLLTTLLLSLISSFHQNEPQQLRAYSPSYAEGQSIVGDGLSYWGEKGVSTATLRAISNYLIERYSIYRAEVYKLPESSGLFFVSGMDDNHDIFIILKADGETMNVVSKVEKDFPCGSRTAYFFIGRDRLLMVVSTSAGDGSFCHNYVLEYVSTNLKAMGEIKVYAGRDTRTAADGGSPMERAVAEYKKNTYFITMRGERGLYSLDKSERQLAPRQSPLTYYFDKTTWGPLPSR